MCIRDSYCIDENRRCTGGVRSPKYFSFVQGLIHTVPHNFDDDLSHSHDFCHFEISFLLPFLCAQKLLFQEHKRIGDHFVHAGFVRTAG